MKVWTKVIKGEKIIKDNVTPITSVDLDSIYSVLEVICLALDEPMPIVLAKHLNHLNEFNSTTFLPMDFVEEVAFNKMVLEIFDENITKSSPKQLPNF